MHGAGQVINVYLREGGQGIRVRMAWGASPTNGEVSQVRGASASSEALLPGATAR